MVSMEILEETSRTSELEELSDISHEFELGMVGEWRRIPNGLINSSYFVSSSKGNFVFQKMGSIFNERTIEDYQTVQSYLRTSGVSVPVLLRSWRGKPFVKKEGNVWRVFEYIESDKTPRISKDSALEAGRLLGKFHNTMAKSQFRPTFQLEGFHDTHRYIKRMNFLFDHPDYKKKAEQIEKEVTLINRNIDRHYLDDALPKTIIHGDPKLDNFLFKKGKAIAILDLDTMMYASELFDLGDALRSWCRQDETQFDSSIFSATMEGYRSENKLSYEDNLVERATGLITLELSSRYLLDYFEESYFSLDRTKYSSRAEQNLARARRYLDYYANFAQKTGLTIS